jgi:predicted O-methyltransferase YrrM
MRQAAKPLRMLGLLGLFERSPRTSFRFWFASQFAIYDAAKLASMDVPWWSTPAIDKVERWIAARNGQVHAFEYGSGASTAWLSRRCLHVTSIEHDAAFARDIAPVIARDNVRLRLIEPTRSVQSPRTASGRSGYEDCDFSMYVDSIAEADMHYDLIVIDGRARAACLERARNQLKAGGLIVFDNSDRRRYQQALADIGANVERCRGWAPALPYRSETALIEVAHP